MESFFFCLFFSYLFFLNKQINNKAPGAGFAVQGVKLSLVMPVSYMSAGLSLGCCLLFFQFSFLLLALGR